MIEKIKFFSEIKSRQTVFRVLSAVPWISVRQCGLFRGTGIFFRKNIGIISGTAFTLTKRSEFKMVYIITGATHTGKTLLSIELAVRYRLSCISLDLLKMGLIRSGNAGRLTAEDDSEIEKLLWPIVVGIVKTAVENRQELVIEGCYVPGDFRRYFDSRYLAHIKVYCLVMTGNYIRSNYDLIIRRENIAERRDPGDRPAIGFLISENKAYRERFTGSGAKIMESNIKYGYDLRPDTVTESERLIYRKIKRSDFSELCEMLKDPEVMYAWEGIFDDRQVRQWIRKRTDGYKENGYDYFAAVDKETGEIVGQIGLLEENINGLSRTGIGYMLKKKHINKGYATEGARAMIKYAFEYLGKEEVIATIRPENTPSLKVAGRLGMTNETTVTKIWNGKIMPHLVFVIKNRNSADQKR